MRPAAPARTGRGGHNTPQDGAFLNGVAVPMGDNSDPGGDSPRLTPSIRSRTMSLEVQPVDQFGDDDDDPQGVAGLTLTVIPDPADRKKIGVTLRNATNRAIRASNWTVRV